MNKYCSRDQKISKVLLIEGSTYPNLLMQIQGTEEIGSTKRKFLLSRVDCTSLLVEMIGTKAQFSSSYKNLKTLC